MTRAVDSFEVIKELFARSPEPTQEEAKEILDALRDVYERLVKVRTLAPATDYSPKMWRLLELGGFKNLALNRDLPSRR